MAGSQGSLKVWDGGAKSNACLGFLSLGLTRLPQSHVRPADVRRQPPRLRAGLQNLQRTFGIRSRFFLMADRQSDRRASKQQHGQVECPHASSLNRRLVDTDTLLGKLYRAVRV